MGYRELEAFRAQAAVFAGIVGDVSDEGWSRPTRCPAFDVRELVAHLGGALSRYAQIAATAEASEVTHDRVRWWSQRDVDEASPRIAEATKKGAEGRSPEEIAAFAVGAAEALAGALDGDPGELRGTRDVGIERAELAAVAVFECGIHTMDLGHALLKGERLDPLAVPVITETLDGLLGGPPLAVLGWSPGTYILTSTGRRPLSRRERHTLGPAAGRFPLIG